MHIIHTIGALGEWGGGPVRSVTQLCDTLADSDLTVSILAGYDPLRDTAVLYPTNPKVSVYFSRILASRGPRLFPGFYRKLHDLVSASKRSHDVVCIHDHGLWSQTNFASARVARALNVPYILSPRGAMEGWAMQYKRWKKSLAWHIYQHRIIADTAIFVAASEKEALSIQRLAPHSRISIIENGVKLPSNEALAARTQPSSLKAALFLSRIHPVKNLGVLLEAWSKVSAQNAAVNWKLLIAGPDELNHCATLQLLAATLGIEASVEFLGPIRDEDKSALFGSAELFVMPSLSENFSVTIAEALAHSIPVIASTGTPWQALALNGCGWWVQPTAEEIAEALHTAISLSCAERHSMGAAGRELVEKRFGWPAIGRRMADLYRLTGPNGHS